jgi:mono/diheme cytochrome c family protein
MKRQPMPRRCHNLAVANGLLLAGICMHLVAQEGLATEPPVPIRDAYETFVAGLVKQHCVKCHSQTRREGGLDLSSQAGILTGGDSGEVIEHDRPSASLLLERVVAREMPPEDEPPLTDTQIEKFRKWIESGAHFQATGPERRVTQHDVIPILLLRCTACHGTRKQEGGLDLRTRESIFKGGRSGPAVVSGRPEDSRLVQRIHNEEMPPRRRLVSVSVKPMTSSELRIIEAWIRAGLPEADAAETQALSQRPEVSDEVRSFWSFQPPKRPVVPSIEFAAAGQSSGANTAESQASERPRPGEAQPERRGRSGRSGRSGEAARTSGETARISSETAGQTLNPVDAFVLAKLREHGLTLAPPADRITLLRRLSFDLTGLPPAREVADGFLADESPAAWSRLIDQLLDSPRYGERWARFWLDAAGYSDSEGAQNEDRVRPHFWRYRDYVIRSFNGDKPYDRFLLEQIAGDELADYEHAGEITPELYDNLVATGFLRTTPDRTFADITNFVPDRLEVIADEMQVFSSTVLGLTLQCARCHDHKFDPLTQSDFYSLTAIFKDAYDEHDWLKSDGPRSLPHVTTAERTAWQQQIRRIDDEIQPLQTRLNQEQDPDRQAVLKKQIDQLAATKPPEPRIRALWSRGQPSPSYLLRRGNYLTPGPPVEPGIPAALMPPGFRFQIEPPGPDSQKTGRRLALARWLTQPDHPLTARVLVNRIWKHHFGRGIVATVGNFGSTGDRPTHPELLDWLTVEFVRNGWSIKWLHRQILASHTWQQSSTIDDVRLANGRMLSHEDRVRLLYGAPLRRLDAEALRDTLLSVADQLDLTPFGPPDGVDESGGGLVTSRRSSAGWRRSIFVQQRRTKMPTLLENFDFPQMSPNCLERSEAIVAPQALHLLNNAMVHELAGRFADRVIAGGGQDPAAQIDDVYRLAISRPPTFEERQVSLDTLAALHRHWTEAGAGNNDEATRKSLASFCHGMMNSAAFLYLD